MTSSRVNWIPRTVSRCPLSLLLTGGPCCHIDDGSHCLDATRHGSLGIIKWRWNYSPWCQLCIWK
jgi:hypothetical protein